MLLPLNFVIIRSGVESRFVPDGGLQLCRLLCRGWRVREREPVWIAFGEFGNFCGVESVSTSSRAR